jgi:SAM-dependent methyltransferase
MQSILKQIKSLGSSYSKASIWGKVLVFTIMLLLLVLFFKGLKAEKGLLEGFEQNDRFLLKSGNDIYDDFYTEIYDYLVFNNLKDEYEIGEIINKTEPTSHSRILDVGCGTGHHVASLSAKGLDVLGIDISESMIKKDKEEYPNYKFEVADATNSGTFEPSTFTHIMCMYFTVYYIKDRTQFFANCFNWLQPGGYLILHLVDRDNFDPILPPGNPLLYVSPQRYAKKRITTTKVKFNDFSYSADFKLDKQNNVAKFEEKFKNDSDGKVRKNEHILYMDDLENIVQEVEAQGFFLESKIDLLHCQYEYQYLYMFVKPN